ncbi:MAG: 50S ribosomal protein L4 [Mycoplasmatales bacterium]
MAKIDVLNLEGTKVDTIEIADDIFAITPNKQALYDAVIMQRASLRQGTHATKGRSEVRGGGKKPWKQKGTGRARQGTIRAPQWKGGGTVFGPTPRSYGYKINRKVRRLALISALALKFSEGKVVVVEELNFAQPKTKDMLAALNGVNATRKPLIVTGNYDENVFLSARNIPGAINLDVRGLNVLDIMSAHSLVLTKDAIKMIEEVLG